MYFSDKKGHSRSDSRTDNSANKGSLKDFLQFFFTNRKNLTEIQDKGIYKGKGFTVNSEIFSNFCFLQIVLKYTEEEWLGNSNLLRNIDPGHLGHF